MDFTFFNKVSIRKCTSALCITDATTSYPFGFPTRSKRPPINIFRWFISVLRSMGKKPVFIRVDEGGELARSRDFCFLLQELGLILQTTGGYASSLNGKSEITHRLTKNMVRSMLQSRGHQDDKWCFAYSYAIWLLRRLLNRRVSKTPYEAWHNKKPSFKDMLIFGSVVYILNASVTRQALDARTMTDLRQILNENDVDGYFMGYANTTKVIVYWDPKTNTIKRAHHCFVDEFETRVSPHQRHTPGALLLAETPGGQYDPTPPPPDEIRFQISSFDIQESSFPADEMFSFQVSIPPQGRRFHIQVGDDQEYHIPFLDRVYVDSPWFHEIPPSARRNMWIVSIDEEEPIMGTSFIDYLHHIQDPVEVRTATLILARRTSHTMTNFQELRASFDQMRPVISHLASFRKRPTTYTNIGDCLKSSENVQWKEALFGQYDKNADANLFTKPIPVSTLPKGTKILRSIISPNIKTTDVPDMYQFITRHCANGSAMIRGLDYQESYSAVALASSVRIVVAIGAAENMIFGIIDVKNAFQNTMIPSGERQHLSLPPFYIHWFRRKYPLVPIEESKDNRYCIQTVNAIQGTKPAGRQWNDILTTVLTKLKFQRNHVDHGVFIYVSDDETKKILLCISTDDFLCAFTHQHLYDDLCTNLKGYFEITTKTGPVLHYLNLRIIQTPESVSIDQTEHIKHKILSDWFQEDGDPLRTTDTPFRTDNEFEVQLSEALPANPQELAALSKEYNGDYRTHMGKFNHIKEWTRPELSYALSRLGSFSVAPTATAFQGLKRIARYIGTHPHKPFFYPRNVSLDGTNILRHEFDQGHYEETQVLNHLECFQDAGLARDLTDRRSMAAMFHFLFGVAVDWKVGKQPAPAPHSTDAELRSMFTAVKRTISVRALMMHLGYGPPAPTRHHEDNQPSIDIVSANQVTSRVRHIHIPICYLHHNLDRGYFRPVFCKGTLMCADMCTKPLAGPLLERHADFIRGLRFAPPGDSIHHTYFVLLT
jgi:hypothetical protein